MCGYVCAPRAKSRLHDLMQQDHVFTAEDKAAINPQNALSINAGFNLVKNPVRCCEHVQELIHKLMNVIRVKKDDPKTKGKI